MGEWRSVKDFVVHFTKGITPNYVDESNVLVLNQKCVRNNLIDYSLARYTDDSKTISEIKIVKVGDILFNSTGQGTAGRCAFVREIPDDIKLITDSHMLLLRCNSYFEARCLNYVLYSYERNIQSFMDGSTGQGELDKIKLFNLLVKIPSDNTEQEKIASVLSALDAKIDLNNRINTQLEAMAKTHYDYWFVQFDFPDENGKPYKSSGGEMVYNTELKRKIPKGWEVKELSSLIEIERGISYKSEEIASTGTPMVNLNSFYLDGKYKTEGIKYFNGKYNDLKVVKSGDLIIATTDVTRNADIIGKANLIPNIYNEDIVLSCDIAKIIPDECLDKFYLEKLFNSTSYHNYIKGFASGTLVLHLNMNGIGWYKTFIPPKDLLNKHANSASPIQKKKDLIIKENQQLVELRDWLLPMLMNGQVKVS